MFRPSTRRRFLGLSALLTVAITILPIPAQSDNYEGVPIIISTGRDSFTAGDPLPCNVEVSAVPANITITSDPPGVVYYSGTLTSTTDTVIATTNSTATPGPVTVYLQVQGSSAAASDTTAVADSVPEVPPHGRQ
jgi:hypothetical protein